MICEQYINSIYYTGNDLQTAVYIVYFILIIIIFTVLLQYVFNNNTNSIIFQFNLYVLYYFIIS